MWMIPSQRRCALLNTSHGLWWFSLRWPRETNMEPVACITLQHLLPISWWTLFKDLHCFSLVFLRLSRQDEGRSQVQGHSWSSKPLRRERHGRSRREHSPAASRHIKPERLVKKTQSRRLSCGLFQISISLNKDEPETSLLALMRTKGADKIRETLGTYVGLLKTGIILSCLFLVISYILSI